MKYSLSFRLKSYLKWTFNFFVGIYNVKFLIRYIAAYRIYKQEKGPSYKSQDANTIIWLYYPTFKVFKNAFMWDILLMASLASNKEKYRLHWGKDIGKFRKKNILYTINKDRLNFFGFENYAADYQSLSSRLEDQQNNVYPSLHDVSYWENKIYMYARFLELGIHTPKTTFYHNFQELIRNETAFPFLIKIPHSSGSFGLFNVKDAQGLQQLANDPIILANNVYIVQERLNITMDMRVILAGEEIIHHYWRKNKDKSVWKTTSTSSGSSVDFEYFPEKWRAYIIAAFKKLNLITGAFDIGWQNDDLDTEPYFFEVSPSYDINPKVTIEKYLNDYGKYKGLLLLKNSFDRSFVEQTYAIKSKAIKIFIEKTRES